MACMRRRSEVVSAFAQGGIGPGDRGARVVLEPVAILTGR